MKKIEQISDSYAVIAFAIIALTYVVNAMDRIVFPMLLPGVIHQYGFSLAAGGLLATIFTLGLGITGVPGGFLFSRLSRKSIAIIGILIYSACTMLTCLSIGFYDMALYRAVSGLGEALQNTAIYTMAGAYFFRNRTLAFGILGAAYGAGSFIGSRWGARLLESTHNWHDPLYIYGCIGLVGVLAVLFFVPRSFSERLAEVAQVRAQDERHIPDRLINRNTVIVAITSVCTGMATFGYVGLYPTFLISKLHFSIHQTGTAASMFGLGALTAIVCGYLADRGNQKIMTLCVLVVFALDGYVQFNLATTPLAQEFLSFLEGAAGSGFMYINNYSLMQRSVRSKRVGQASGLAVTCIYLPAAVSGYCLAKLEHWLGWGGAASIQLCAQLGIGFVAILFFQLERTSCPIGNAAVSPDPQIAL